MSVKPLYVMGRWRHPKTRDGRLAVAVVLSTGVLECENGVRAEIMDGDRLLLTFTWPRVIMDAEGIMPALLSFSTDLRDGRGPLLAQGL